MQFYFNVLIKITDLSSLIYLNFLQLSLKSIVLGWSKLFYIKYILLANDI